MAGSLLSILTLTVYLGLPPQVGGVCEYPKAMDRIKVMAKTIVFIYLMILNLYLTYHIYKLITYPTFIHYLIISKTFSILFSIYT